MPILCLKQAVLYLHLNKLYNNYNYTLRTD